MICSWEEFAFLAIPILLAYPKTLQLQNLRVGLPFALWAPLVYPARPLHVASTASRRVKLRNRSVGLTITSLAIFSL